LSVGEGIDPLGMKARDVGLCIVVGSEATTCG
jgi:hypothetical protein